MQYTFYKCLKVNTTQKNVSKSQLCDTARNTKLFFIWHKSGI